MWPALGPLAAVSTPQMLPEGLEDLRPGGMVSGHFAADWAKFDEAFRALDALVDAEDGFTYVDESKVPADLLRSYRRLMQYGAANGLI